MTRTHKSKKPYGDDIWILRGQPSWLIGGPDRCRRLVEIWYKNGDWTDGEWGVRKGSTNIFDEDWSRWTESEKRVIHVMKDWGVATVMWIDFQLVDRMVKKVRKESI